MAQYSGYEGGYLDLDPNAATGVIDQTFPPFTTAISALHGGGSVIQTFPPFTTAATGITGATPAASIDQTFPPFTTAATGTVDFIQPPPTPSGPQGLVHIFQRGASSRVLPVTTGSLALRYRVSGFRDRANMVGGYQSASGVIPEAELIANPTIYQVGTLWLVKDLALEAAGRPPYVFAGELKEPQPAAGVVQLAADGWGLMQERQVERFLLASQSLDFWAPGDEKPFNFPGGARISSDVKGQRIVFEIEHFTSFKRNNANQPAVWRSYPVVFWAPKVSLRWISFTIAARGRNMKDYELQLVGTPTGPTGALTILRTWWLGNDNLDEVSEFQIPGGYDLVGFRVVRNTEVKKAPHVRVVLTDIQIGALATSAPYTLNQAYATLFGMMGTASNTIAASTQDVLPYDAARVSLADIGDDLGVLGQWYWRLWADATGAKIGEAGPIGETVYHVTLTHTPVRPLPQPRFNVVQYDYNYGGGYIAQDTVRASPDPFPSTDQVYVLNLDEPPVQALATRFAQKIADFVSKEWFSGSGVLHKVDPGALPAAVVRPGMKLILDNYAGKEVIVDEVTHSEDGALLEVTFAESSKIVDRWLTLRQQRINQGLSPDGATLALLDAARPKPPTVTAGFTSVEDKEGRKDYNLEAVATLVTEDIENEGTFVQKYEFRARPINAQGNPVSDSAGGGWRGRHVRAPYDDEAEETKRVVWTRIENPHQWSWEVQGWAVDAMGQRSDRAPANPQPGKPSAFGPPNPTQASLDVDNHSMTVEYVIPDDPLVPGEPDPGFHHAYIDIADNPAMSAPIRVDRKVFGEKKTFRVQKPGNGTYWARVRFKDYWGNTSNPLIVSNSKRIPPVPTIGSPSFDAAGTRHARYRLRVPVSVNDAGHDDFVRRIQVQLCHSPSAGQPTAADRKIRDWVRVGDDPQEALFRNIPKNHFCFVRALSQDVDGKESQFTAWLGLGRARDSGISTIPPPPTGLLVTKPVPRRCVGDWDEPDDDEAVRWRVVVRRGSTVVQTGRVRNTRFVYRVPKSDVLLLHSMDVYAINDLGIESSPATDSTSPDDDDAGGAADAPGTIKHYAGGAPPSGWLKCNGNTHQTGLYPALFAAIGYTYGPPFSGSTFAVPDMRRRHARGHSDDGSESLGGSEGNSFDNREEDHGKHKKHKHKHKHRKKHPDHDAQSNTNQNTGVHTHGIATGTTFINIGSPTATVPAGNSASQNAAGPQHGHAVSYGGNVGTGQSDHFHAGVEIAGSYAKATGISTPLPGGGIGAPGHYPHSDALAEPDGPPDHFTDSMTGGPGWDAGPTDDVGTNIDIDEDGAAPQKGHKKHPHLKVHFIIKT